jgi:hypothetical protein
MFGFIGLIQPYIGHNAFLERPALSKFMAIPHYAYLVLKMPGPHDVISIRGDIKRAYDCDRESYETVDRLTTSVELQELKKALAECPPPPQTRSCPRSRHSRRPSSQRTHSARWSRYPWVSPIKLLTWGIVWIQNRNPHSSNSSTKIGTPSHGSLLTCLEFLGS